MTDRERLIDLLYNLPVAERVIGIRAGKTLLTAGNIADYLMDNGVTFQKWVPVALGFLPDEDGTYLVRTTSGAVTTARFYKEMTFPPTAYRNEEYVRKASFQSNRHVTHWMPLPEPPKEGE